MSMAEFGETRPKNILDTDSHSDVPSTSRGPSSILSTSPRIQMSGASMWDMWALQTQPRGCLVPCLLSQPGLVTLQPGLALGTVLALSSLGPSSGHWALFSTVFSRPSHDCLLASSGQGVKGEPLS